MSTDPRHAAADYLAALDPAELAAFLAEALPPVKTPAEQFVEWMAEQFDPNTVTIPMEDTQS